MENRILKRLLLSLVVALMWIGCDEFGSVVDVVVSPVGGYFDYNQRVSLSCATQGATIYYTLNGDDPTVASKVYSGPSVLVYPIVLYATTTVKAIAIRGDSTSAIATAVFTKRDAVTISPNGGNFFPSQQVTLSCAINGSTFYYTTDDTPPDSSNSAQLYSKPFSISETTTVRAIGMKEDLLVAPEATAVFKLAPATIYVSAIGVADGVGTEDSPVKTIEKAIILLSDGGTIWVMDTIEVSATGISWVSPSGGTIILKRYSTAGALIDVTGGTLTLENITIDGQGNINDLGGSVESDSPLIRVGSGGTVQLNDGAILQNNKNISDGGGGVAIYGNFIMRGGTISHNTVNNGGGGMAIFDSGTLDLGTGSTINISDNTLVDGTLNNIYYTNAELDSPITVTSVLSGGSTIGLTPSNMIPNYMLVKAGSGIIIDPTHFGLDDGRVLDYKDPNLVVSYVIGDTGPGGGMVFSTTETTPGKRYLECSDNLGEGKRATGVTLATDYKGGGKTDWRLPLDTELNAIYENLCVPKIIVVTDDNRYWSSSVNENGWSYVRSFLNDNCYWHGDPNVTYHVRAVRSF